jgi:hypothetical protein
MSELINQGGFGCIFYPGFNCKGEATKKLHNSVTKLQINDFAGENEIYIGSLIKELPNYSLYFLPVIGSCSIGLASLNPKYIDKCKIISKNDSEYLLLELPYMKNISFQKLFSDKFRTNKHLFVTFIETYQYITGSIGQLLDINVVHYDLKQENILYSTKYENPILIDFGISIPIDKVEDENLSDYFYVYAPDYSLWAPEIHAINYLVNVGDTLTGTVIDKLMSDYVTHNMALHIFSDDFKERYKQSGIKWLKKYENKNKYDVIKELLSFYKTWDLYSLSIMYLKFFKILFMKGFFESNLIIAFSQLLLTNISPNPTVRLSIHDTLIKYKDMFYINEKPEDYFTLMDNLNYENIV